MKLKIGNRYKYIRSGKNQAILEIVSRGTCGCGYDWKFKPLQVLKGSLFTKDTIDEFHMYGGENIKLLPKQDKPKEKK